MARAILVGLGWVAGERVKGQEGKRTRGRPYPEVSALAGPFDDVFGMNSIIPGYASARSGVGRAEGKSESRSGSESESGLNARAKEEERGRGR